MDEAGDVRRVVSTALETAHARSRLMVIWAPPI